MIPNKKIERQSLEYYLSLKYPIFIYPEEVGYTLIIPDLPGCMTQGKTLKECIVNIEEARELWIETVYTSAKKDIGRSVKSLIPKSVAPGHRDKSW